MIFFRLITLFLAIHGQQALSETTKGTTFVEDADFWVRLVEETTDSFVIPTEQPSLNPTPKSPAPSKAPTRPTNAPTVPPIPSPTINPTEFVPTTAPSGPPSEIPSPIPSFVPISVPSVTPSFSLAPSESSAPTSTPYPTTTARPTASDVPSSSLSSPPFVNTSEEPTGRPTSSSSVSPTVAPIPTTSPGPTVTPIPTMTPYPTVTPIPTTSPGPTVTPIPTTSPGPTVTPIPTTSPGPTVTPIPTMTPYPTVTPIPTMTPYPTVTPIPTTSPGPTVTPIPTTSPGPTVTPIPTMTPEPTVLPPQTTCIISTDITCENEDGDACDFASPIGEQCIGSNAKELRFLYTANSFCMGNNTQESFSCVDEINTDVPRSSTVYINIFIGDDVFYEGIVNEGNVFRVPVADDTDSVVIVISDLNESFGPGILLQTMMMSVQCREEDSLVLLDTFGGLQLVGYRNKEQGLKIVFASVSIRYAVANLGRQDLFLTSAIKTTPFAEMVSILPSDESLVIEPMSSETFSELLALNLAAIAGTELNFFLLVQADDAITGGECGDSDTYTLAIQQP
jgi:hypothetical protein